MAKFPIALQLYTVRDLTKSDFAGTVKEVAGIGYSAVEMAGYGNLKTAAEAKKALDDAGLKVAAAHVGIDQLEKNLGRVLDESALLGNSILVCPYVPDDRRKDAAGWKAVGATLTRIAGDCAKKGIALAYHNHSFEFQLFDGKSGMDILWDSSDSKLVKAELDVYWIKHGGADPVQYIQKLGKRLLLLHLKDMSAGPERRFAEVGGGILDFRAILAAGIAAGAKWGIVEQDNCYGGSPLDAARKSFENLKKLGAV